MKLASIPSLRSCSRCSVVAAAGRHESQLFVGGRRAEVSSNSFLASFLPSKVRSRPSVRPSVRPARSLFVLPCRPPAPPPLGKWVSSTRRYLGRLCCRRCQGCCHPGRGSDSVQRGRKTQVEEKSRQRHGRILVVDPEPYLAVCKVAVFSFPHHRRRSVRSLL